MTLLADDVDLSLPYLVGDGPVQFSTCTALVPTRDRWVADPNGYYRDLGVHPRATRTELRDAYLRLDGQNSPHLTYVLTQLLNPQVRARYDRATLGDPIMDRYGIEIVLRTITGNDFEKKAHYLHRIESLNELLDSQGSLDSGDESGNDGGASPDDGTHHFPYSYYVFRSTTNDPSVLSEWQRLLVSAFRRERIEVSMALGIHDANSAPWMIRRVGYLTVVFLRQQECPRPTLADDVARYFAMSTPQETRT